MSTTKIIIAITIYLHICKYIYIHVCISVRACACACARVFVCDRCAGDIVDIGNGTTSNSSGKLCAHFTRTPLKKSMNPILHPAAMADYVFGEDG